jgi:hypothetical protein
MHYGSDLGYRKYRLMLSDGISSYPVASRCIPACATNELAFNVPRNVATTVARTVA